MNAGSIEVNGFKLHYRIEGEGPTTLVVGSTLYYSRSFSKELRKHLRLVFVDYRGFGEALFSEKETTITFDALLDDIEYVREKLGLKDFVIIGHSAHALLALEYAKKYPKNVSHVVMIGISPNLGPENAALAERYWEESVWPERKAALEKRIQDFSDDKLANLPPRERFVMWNVRRVPQSWYDFNFDSSVLWEGVKPNMSILDYFYGVALKDLDITKGLDAFNKPVFLALGRYDYIMAPPHLGILFVLKFQNLRVRVFEHSAHSPQYEEPALFDQELLNWLKNSCSSMFHFL